MCFSLKRNLLCLNKSRTFVKSVLKALKWFLEWATITPAQLEAPHTCIATNTSISVISRRRSWVFNSNANHISTRRINIHIWDHFNISIILLNGEQTFPHVSCASQIFLLRKWYKCLDWTEIWTFSTSYELWTSDLCTRQFKNKLKQVPQR